MTDKELLEAAAKAAGLEFKFDKPTGMPRARVPGSGDAFPYWNPLHDDAHALRLAVKLNLWIASDSVVGESFCADSPDEDARKVCVLEPHDRCAYTSTRRAIVRAAAVIGAAQ